MEKKQEPVMRQEKKLVKSGNSKAVILPMFFLGDDTEKVVMEIYKNHAVIIPVRKARK